MQAPYTKKHNRTHLQSSCNHDPHTQWDPLNQNLCLCRQNIQYHTCNTNKGFPTPQIQMADRLRHRLQVMPNCAATNTLPGQRLAKQPAGIPLLAARHNNCNTNTLLTTMLPTAYPKSNTDCDLRPQTCVWTHTSNMCQRVQSALVTPEHTCTPKQTTTAITPQGPADVQLPDSATKHQPRTGAAKHFTTKTPPQT